MRKAIAMIELIFSIAIMGIVMMSVPMLITTATKSSQVAFQQESIAIASSHANALMTYSWDEQNTDSQPASQQNRILKTVAGDSELQDRNATKETNTSRQLSTVLASTTLGFDEVNSSAADNHIPDDVDDFNDYNSTLILESSSDPTSNTGNYMDRNVSLHTTVVYGGDNANYAACATSTGCAFSHPFTLSAASTTNIKRITIKLTSTNTDADIHMKFFMCNIGAAELKKEVF